MSLWISLYKILVKISSEWTNLCAGPQRACIPLGEMCRNILKAKLCHPDLQMENKLAKQTIGLHLGKSSEVESSWTKPWRIDLHRRRAGRIFLWRKWGWTPDTCLTSRVWAAIRKERWAGWSGSRLQRFTEAGQAGTKVAISVGGQSRLNQVLD